LAFPDTSIVDGLIVDVTTTPEALALPFTVLLKTPGVDSTVVSTTPLDCALPDTGLALLKLIETVPLASETPSTVISFGSTKSSTTQHILADSS
jgi:hypothetical protein